MVKVAVVKKKDNGDVEYKVLNDMDTDMRWLKWSIIFIFVAVLCPLFLKNISVISVYIVAGLLAAIGIGIFVCLALRSHSLGKAEEKLVINIINNVVARDAEARKVKMLKVKFCSDCLDSYGTIDEEYVLALLDNEIVLKYPIRQLKRKNERYNHKLVVRKCEVCENDEQKKQMESIKEALTNDTIDVCHIQEEMEKVTKTMDYIKDWSQKVRLLDAKMVKVKNQVKEIVLDENFDKMLDVGDLMLEKADVMTQSVGEVMNEFKGYTERHSCRNLECPMRDKGCNE